MIRIGERLKTVLMHPRELSEEDYRRRLQGVGCYPQPLLLETVGNDKDPRCPSCLADCDEDALVKGAGLMVCWHCGQPFVFLRFLGGAGSVQWCTFPWPH